MLNSSNLALLLFALCIVTRAHAGTDEEDKLIGWKGESYQKTSSEQSVHPRTSGQEPWIETVSWKPRAFIYHGFLSSEECDHLIAKATGRLQRSEVVGEQYDAAVDPVRTSYSASLNIHEDKVVKAVEQRISRWIHLPEQHAEPMEVLRYELNQKYDAHWDWFEERDVGKEGNRVATVLMYLSDGYMDGGGETSLPLADLIDDDLQAPDDHMSGCAAARGLAVRPRKGDALLFWDMHVDGLTPDRRTLHAACPALKGTKWTATKWFHNKANMDPVFFQDPDPPEEQQQGQ